MPNYRVKFTLVGHGSYLVTDAENAEDAGFEVEFSLTPNSDLEVDNSEWEVTVDEVTETTDEF